MNDPRGPARLAELAAIEPELAAAIAGVRAERASGAQLDSLAERLAPQLAGAPSGAGSSAGSWVKPLLGTTVVMALVVGAYLAARQRSEESPRVIAHARSEPVAATAPVATRTAVPAAPAVRIAPPLAGVAEPVVRSVGHRVPSAPMEHAPAPTPEDELALLEHARTELDREPSATLALVAQHERTFEHGLFAQEREVLAIEALLKLKRRSAARERAAAFMQSYPDSPHARRVRGLLELMPAPPK